MLSSQYTLPCSERTADFIMDAIRRIYANDHYFTYDSMLKTCSEVKAMMHDLNLADVKTYHFPAKGTNDHGGWLMPLGWHVRSAGLAELLPDGTEKKLCSYGDTPCSLMLYSQNCDVTAEMVIAAPDADLKGKFVLVTDHFFSYGESLDFFNRGAAGVLGGWMPCAWLGQPGYEYLNDACQWHNYTIPFWSAEPERCGFSLTPNQSKYLQEQLKKNGKVILHAKADASLSEGTIPMVTGLFPGETDEEIVLTGHLFEEGADDNASGCAMALGIIRELIARGIRPKRGIRLMFTHEIKSLQAYLNSNPELPKMAAGLNLDMVGVSTDKKVNIGDSFPVFPNYAPCLLKPLLEQTGFIPDVHAYSGMDDHFSTPEYKVPMSFIDMFGTPDYHRSTDTPDRIDRATLMKTFEAAGSYVKFLMNAGYDEALQLEKMVLDYVESRVEYYLTTPARPGYSSPAPAFAARTAKERLESILPLVEPERQQEFRTGLVPLFRKAGELCSRLESAAIPEAAPEVLEALSKITFRKKFKGFFSFEKYMMRKEEYPEIVSIINGWSAPLWIQNMLMFADGTRNARQIWQMMAESGVPAKAEEMLAMLHFLEQEKYIER